MCGVRERTGETGRNRRHYLLWAGLYEEEKVSGSHRAQRTTVDVVICVWCFESSMCFFFHTPCTKWRLNRDNIIMTGNNMYPIWDLLIILLTWDLDLDLPF